MCAAARVDPETGSRCREHFRAACRAVARLGGMSNAKRCWAVWGPLIIAPKVHFLNSALSEECPVCMTIVLALPDRWLGAQRARRGTCTRQTDAKIGTEMRKPIPGKAG